MSSLRNAVKRKEHKERSQPESRQRYGILEKKKDYRQRADDYHKKRDAIKILMGKAAERNPDEFYFAMERKTTVDGVHKARSGVVKEFSQEQLALMRTQDIAYLRRAVQSETAKRDRLQTGLHFLGAARPINHKVFVDSKEELKSFSPAKYFQCSQDIVERSYNRPRSGDAHHSKGNQVSTVDQQALTAARSTRVQYDELARRTKRVAQLKDILTAMEMQQLLAGKGRNCKVKVRGDGKIMDVHKWKRERKK